MDYEIAKDLGESEAALDYSRNEDRIVQANIDMLPKGDKAGHRAQHPKGHATVSAKFVLLPIADEDADLRIGLFEKDDGVEFDAFVRFSNSKSYEDDPTAGDAHGMAIKVVGIGGQKFEEDADHPDSVDFILMNNETFFTGNLSKYARLNGLAGEIIDAQRNGLQKFWGLVNGATIFAWLTTFEPTMKKAITQISSKKPKSPVTEKYWSTTPYLLGSDHAVKYIMAPSDGNTAAVDQTRSENYLQQRLREALDAKPQPFILPLHVLTKGRGDTIEDPTVPWKSTRVVPVAKLTIPQVAASDNTTWAELRKDREKFGYNIWNTPPEHRPLGAINRVRRNVYSTLHDIRNDQGNEVYE
jgi:hypothetical protein